MICIHTKYKENQREIKSVLVRFLDASTHLYKMVCPSVGPSVRPSVRPSVTRSFPNARKRVISTSVIDRGGDDERKG